jgi:hypothetical protein
MDTHLRALMCVHKLKLAYFSDFGGRRHTCEAVSLFEHMDKVGGSLLTKVNGPRSGLPLLVLARIHAENG